MVIYFKIVTCINHLCSYAKCFVDLYILFLQDTYVFECSAIGDNEDWCTTVGGCHSNFMPGIGSQVNLKDLGFTYRKQQLVENSYMSLILSNLAKK